MYINVAMSSNNLRIIKCPVCSNGKILIEKITLHKAKLQTYSPSNADKAEWFVKCPKCKNQIGFGIEIL